ncbi:ABC transporter permease [Planotetraspora sp. A-T 1434]|uniref:ABC transporter permease n=1 Tax=Planotetraspora sp. A-T 1434 TaxID=2979219 RepID=UPI0021BE8B8B|nr:ABC transporter permease [Planotetraspora sp. A-T 1434]MCT9934442.1 ABC transporter permease [Planotetraspora sp. A-T 1434]
MTAIPLPLPRRRFGVALAVGAALVAAWTVVALLWPSLAPFDPGAQDPLRRFAAPGAGHLLGTDQFGRDTFSRMLAGARPVLQVAPLATVLGVLLGTAIGLVAGTLGGLVDEIVMRLLDAVAVFPAIIAAVLFVALAGRSVTVMVLVIAGAFTPIVARSVRAATLVEREKPYVEAARLRGERPWALMGREILPNVGTTVLVEATSRFGDAIFAAATLSFLGLGQPPGSPDWGASVSDNRVWLQIAPWTVLAPALAIASLVVGIALVADALRARWEAS